MTHGHHINAKSSDMAKSTMCVYSQSYHELPHFKCFIQCCAKCTSVDPPDQETDYQYSDTSTSIRFHIYHLIAHCSTHGRLPLNEEINAASVNRIML